MLVARLTILERAGADAVIRFLPRVLAFALLLYALGYALFAVLLPRPAGDERTDAIVVLTGGTRPARSRLRADASAASPGAC